MINLSRLLLQDLIEATGFAGFRKGLGICVDNGNTRGDLRCFTGREQPGLLI